MLFNGRFLIYVALLGVVDHSAYTGTDQMENRIIIEVSKQLSEADFGIGVASVGWQTVYHPVFSNCEFNLRHLPGDPGIHILKLAYKEKLFSSTAFFSMEPLPTAQVCFNFFTQGDKIYCTLSSTALEGLNQTVEFRDFEADASQLSLNIDKVIMKSLKAK